MEGVRDPGRGSGEGAVRLADLVDFLFSDRLPIVGIIVGAIVAFSVWVLL